MWDNLSIYLNIILFHKLSQVEMSLKNYLTINQIKPCDNLMLKLKFFDSKLKSYQGLILVQREPIF